MCLKFDIFPDFCFLTKNENLTLALVAVSFLVSNTLPADFFTSSLRLAELLADLNMIKCRLIHNS